MAYLGKFICALSVLLEISAAGEIPPSGEAGSQAFATDLLKVIASGKPDENVIYSPLSIHSCFTLAFLGAGGQTADELRTALRLRAGDKAKIGKAYGDFLRIEFKPLRLPDDPILKMANRIYVNKDLTIAPEFNEITKSQFNSEAEQIDFGNSAGAVQQINNWVAQQTENKIEKVLQDGAVNDLTSAVLVNAIYFKAKWKYPFTPEMTRKKDFHVSASQKTQVDMMRQKDKFPYGELSDIDAKAVELPYKNSDLSMLIILPNQVDGLKALESKLGRIDLNQISTRLELEEVSVHLPKFKIDFDVDLKEPLEKLGTKQLFSNQANLSELFTVWEEHKISDAKHKAYLNVNEAGSEAAAVTVLKVAPVSFNSNLKHFDANHPFVFAIRNHEAVFFAGHVAKF